MQYFVSTSLSIFHPNTQASVEDSTHQEGEEEGLIMAVEAQYPSPAVFRHARNDTTTSTLEDFHHQTTKLGGDANNANLLGVYNNYNYNYNYNYVGQPHIMNGTVFSEPESELTCNISGSRKRFREDHHFNGNLASSQQQMLNQQQQQQLLQIQQQQLMLSKWPPKEQFMDKSTTTSICTPSSLEDNRLNGSGGTSTSGRSSVLPSSYLVSSPHSQDLNANLLGQNLEIDALILLQNEKLRSGLEETRKRHCRSLVHVLEQQVVKKLEEKETELANASRRNAELEEKIKQMSAENQIWFNVAKNNEAIASSLRSSLEQIVIQNQNQENEGLQVKKEGFGDSSIGGIVADDAQSCCNYVNDEENTTSTAAALMGAFAHEKTIRENRELKQSKSCKVCHQNEISVLLLPCRHLCLCKHCDTKFTSCPICNSLKNASLQVFIS